jgi:hypothetical protein
MFEEKSAGFELILCLEKLERDLQAEIEERKGSARPYTEEELWTFLQGTVGALGLAQSLVSAI